MARERGWCRDDGWQPVVAISTAFAKPRPLRRLPTVVQPVTICYLLVLGPIATRHPHTSVSP